MSIIRCTRSVCPVCLRPLSAVLTGRGGGAVVMEKSCPEHGFFSATVWRGKTDFDGWRGQAAPLKEGEGLSCPQSCGICPGHLQGSCCVLLEVTRRCDLHCRYCFAGDGGPEPGPGELRAAVDGILSHGLPLIQLSGGEPTLRGDLPELVGYIRSKGVKYIQLNSNGLRLADEPKYVRALAHAGLSFVFLQFDGVTEDVYESLRGGPLLERKRRAIEVCGREGLGVTLVPTVVRGVNDGQIGDIIRFGAALSPVVRGVHFQPVSFFGRYPKAPDDGERYTLDELVEALGLQAGIASENIAPSRCDHPGCGLHASFVVTEDGGLTPLTRRRPEAERDMTTAARNREYIGSRWRRDPEAEAAVSRPRAPAPDTCCCGAGPAPDLSDMGYFAARAASHGFTVTAMAFQDAWNLDIERLRRCSLHVWRDGVMKPFCAAYLTGTGGETDGIR